MIKKVDNYINNKNTYVVKPIAKINKIQMLKDEKKSFEEMLEKEKNKTKKGRKR